MRKESLAPRSKTPILVVSSIVGLALYLLFPASTGAELEIVPRWSIDVVDLERVLDRDSRSGFQELVAFGKIVELEPEGDAGYWIPSQDFVQISDEYWINYRYSDPVKPVLARNSGDILVAPQGYLPFALGDWIFGISEDRQAVTLRQGGTSLGFSPPYRWASLVTDVAASASAAYVGLVDGRVFPFVSPEIMGPVLEPKSDWYRLGQTEDRIVAGLLALDEVLAVVYGSRRPVLVLWDLGSRQIRYESVIDIVGLQQIVELKPYANEHSRGILLNTSSESRLFLFTDSWEESARLEFETRGRIDQLRELPGLGMSMVWRNGSAPSLVPHTDLGQTRIVGQDFEGSIMFDNSRLLWLGELSAGMVEIQWFE